MKGLRFDSIPSGESIISTADLPYCTNQLESTVPLHQSSKLPLGVATHPLTKDKPSNRLPLRCLENRASLFLGSQPNAINVLPCATSLSHNQRRDKERTDAILLRSTSMRVSFSLQQSLHECLASLLSRFYSSAPLARPIRETMFSTNNVP